MSKKVKIVVLSPYEDLSSCEHRPVQEAEYFSKKGCNVEILVMQRKAKGKGIIENQIQGISAKHFLCKTDKMEKLLNDNFFFRKMKPIIYFKWFLQFIRFLSQECKNEKNTFLVAHNLEMAVASCIANRKRENHVVFVMRELYEGQVTNRIKSRIIRTVSRWAQNRSDFLVHVGPVQISVTQKKNKHKILYIPNYPVAENYKNIEFTDSKELRVNYIGSVRDKKSLTMLMDAAKDIAGLKIGIHGMGEAYPALKELESQYENVEITGYYDYKKDTRRLFANTDIVYCAYNIEILNWKKAYPIKFYESMEAGLPVMICKGMAPEDLVKENGCGFVFEYNVASLHNLLLYLVNNREEVEKKKLNIKKLKGKYTWENVVHRYDALFDFEERGYCGRNIKKRT